MSGQLTLDDLPPGPLDDLEWLAPAPAPAWRSPAPALAGPGWQISDHSSLRYQPRHHTRAIRAALPLIEQQLGDRLAYEAYLDASTDDYRPYQHHRAMWARKNRLAGSNA